MGNPSLQCCVYILCATLGFATPSLAQGPGNRPGGGSGFEGGGGPGGMGGPGGPGGPEGRPPSPRGSLYDIETVQTVTGTVQSIAAPRGDERPVVVTLRTKGGDLPVQLGPSSVLESLPTKLSVGNDIMVRGSKITMGGSALLLAAQITVRGETLRLRDPDTGVPLWGPTGGNRSSDGPQPGAGGPGAGPPPGSESQVLGRSRIRSAWLIPEGEVRGMQTGTPLSLEEFAVAGMLRNLSRKSLGELLEMHRTLGSWDAVAAKLGGRASEAATGGSPEIPFQVTEGAPAAEAARAREEHLVLLAQVKTLERLTGRSTKTVLGALRSSSFESLLLETSSAQGSKAQEERGAPQAPPGGPGQGGGPPGGR